jgi:hypothetical protein
LGFGVWGFTVVVGPSALDGPEEADRSSIGSKFGSEHETGRPRAHDARVVHLFRAGNLELDALDRNLFSFVVSVFSPLGED